jgi:predicted acylesterase/phospholipase RssA
MKYLAIGPGAMGLFIFMGALQRLEDTGNLKDLEEISGSSAGSLLGFFYLLTKRDLAKTFDHALKTPIKQIMKPNIKSLFNNFGLVPVSKVRKVLSQACFEFTSKNEITFEEFYRWCPVKFHVSAFCVDLKRTDYFNVDQTPTMSVLDAICMSISVPFLFSVSKFNEWHYVDGGSAESIPCAPFMGKPKEETLALELEFSNKKKNIKDLKQYGLEVMASILHLRSKYEDIPRITMSIEAMDMFDFSVDSETKIRMFMIGQGYANLFCNSKLK